MTELWVLAHRLAEFGIEATGLALDWPAAVARAQHIVAGCADPKPAQLTAHGAQLIHGSARFVDAHTVEVDSRRFVGEQILIATGARPPRLLIPGLEHAVTHVEALEWQELPRSLAIIGGGFIGLEFAFMFARIGTRVVLFELLDHVLAGVDGEIRGAVVRQAQQAGITIVTGVRVQALVPQENGFRVTVDPPESAVSDGVFDRVLLAAGQVAAVEALDLDRAGVTTSRDGVVTDATLRTATSHIWAAGDVRAGAPKLTQVASYEGRLAVHNALRGHLAEADEGIVPYLIGLTPPVAAVGLTEEEARAAGHTVGVHRQSYRDVCPAGNVVGEPEGIFKVVFDAGSGTLLGAHAVGAGAPELVQQVAFALQGRLTLRQAGSALFTFPGLSEVVWYALRPHPGDPA